MTSIRCHILVDEMGRAVLQLPGEILPGEHEVTISVNESVLPQVDKVDTLSGEWDSLLSAGVASLDFWDNPIDDEIWNHA